ncbi:MAG TPA: S41 family peptidase [Pseudothermotoga sp.]|nr:S41 family peptidase [Pseudothermotoga sp.]HOK84299.1 S41 family peptidase [Pseudothermotoga sp.]HPP70867.1 S41 family peptidase [Pseudothermotoga sp.]
MKRNSLLFVIILSVSVIFASWILSAAVTPKDVNKALEPFYQTLSYILNTYYQKDEVDLNKLMDSAIDGLVKGLRDDFSYYENPEAMEEKQIELEGEYGGLGIEVTYDSEYKAVKVISPMYGTPAWKAGLKANDRIVTIDDQPVSEMEYMEAVRKLRGQPGTTVKIKVVREGVDSLLTFELVREKIQIIPVKHALIETTKGRVGYTLITRFGAKTSEEMAEALNDIFDKGVKGLIVDLRDNPGGYLNSAIEVASYFIDKGIVVKTKNAYGVEEVYESKGNNYPNVPIVVLVNGGSASASEILTGALKDYQIAKIVGQKTFGKGSVQTGFPLSNGGTLYLTTAHYMTPSGKDIHKIGIDPDVFVQEATDTERQSAAVDYTKKVIELDMNDPYIIKGLEVLLEMVK